MLTRDEYAQTLTDLLQIEAPNVSPVPGSGTLDGYDNDVVAGVVTARHVDAYLDLGAEVVDQALAQNRAALVPCAAGCEQEFVDQFGRLAFRRPLRDEERTRYLGLFDASLTEGVFDEGVKLVMRAMLLSSSFLYRSEVGEGTEPGSFALTPHELATALSYTFWGTLPDAELRNAADAGALSNAEQLEAQARRLLADERSRPQVARFFTQWLGTRSLQNANKDLYIFPHFNEEVRAGLIAEEEAFVEHVVFDGTGQFSELFAADYVFANQITGAFYNLSAPPSGTAMELVSTVQNPERGGLLTLGSVLASHAHSMETSPVKRGVMVRERILCQELLPPPLNVDTTPPGLDPSLTTRERFARHTDDPTCSSCHQLIDSIGFGFEEFDGVGAFRTDENGIPVDGSGRVVALETGSSEVTSFNGPRELSLVLAESPTAQACLARQFAQFARGFHAKEADACVADIAEQFRATLDIQDLMVSVVQSPSFSVRGAGVAQP